MLPAKWESLESTQPSASTWVREVEAWHFAMQKPCEISGSAWHDMGTKLLLNSQQIKARPKRYEFLTQIHSQADLRPPYSGLSLTVVANVATEPG
jgi:hypothetical protein